MSDFFPWDDIQEGSIFPTGIYEFEIVEIKDGKSSGEKRMPNGYFRCTQPAKFQGMPHFENFVCGTEENLSDFVQGARGTKLLKSVFVKSQTPKGTSFEELMMSAVGNRLQLHLSKSTQEGGPYHGKEQNQIVACYKVGERELGPMEDKKASVASAPKASSGAPSTIPCNICGEQIPMQEYSKHTETCKG